MVKHLPNCLKSMHCLLLWTSGLVQRNQNMVKRNVTITRKHNINSHAICSKYVMPINCKKKQTGWTCVFNRKCIKSALKELKTWCIIMHVYKCNVWTWCGNSMISLCFCFASFTVVYFITLSISRTIKDYEIWRTGDWRSAHHII